MKSFYNDDDMRLWDVKEAPSGSSIAVAWTESLNIIPLAENSPTFSCSANAGPAGLNTHFRGHFKPDDYKPVDYKGLL